ncbi:MAG: potassium-transporting ATPase subunit C [Alphaproteobacteria bacterium]|jgi:K+-transporting ATPase ATPase C chain|nr:potassium-transporting ATPase subunit C [Alphaproteobacteria bacterium]
MKRQLKISFWFTFYATACLGVVYPMVVTGAGLVIPSTTQVKLLEHPIQTDEFFHGRPSMSGGPYSGASNLSLTNPELWKQVERRLKEHSKYMLKGMHVPRDLLFASGSGYDPDISLPAALHQLPGIDKARPMNMQYLSELVDQHVQPRLLGFIGTTEINVIKLNESLEKRCHVAAAHNETGQFRIKTKSKS